MLIRWKGPQSTAELFQSYLPLRTICFKLLQLRGSSFSVLINSCKKTKTYLSTLLLTVWHKKFQLLDCGCGISDGSHSVTSDSGWSQRAKWSEWELRVDCCERSVWLVLVQSSRFASPVVHLFVCWSITKLVNTTFWKQMNRICCKLA